MKPDQISEHEETYSEQYRVVPCTTKRLVKSADGDPEDEEEDWDDSHDIHDIQDIDDKYRAYKEPRIPPMIKKEDLAQGIVFGKDIVKSEQYSIDQSLLNSANKEKLHNELTGILKEDRRTTHLNIIVCGGKEVGKSCFIDAFLNAKLQPTDSIRHQTTSILEKKALKRISGTTFEVSLIDTPGYQEGCTVSYITLVKEYLKQKLKRHHLEEERNLKDRNRIISGNKSEILDERVHCCLYFLKGPRIHDEDCKIMAALQSYVNIIPVIAKGDCYTLEEIKQIKKDLLLKKEEHKIGWLECEEIIRSQDPDKLKQLLEGPFGKSPPFVVISAVCSVLTKSDRIVQGREYTWGVCDINNSKHSDFQLLCQMLVTNFAKPLIEFTTWIETSYIKVREKKKDESQGKIFKYFGGGIIAGFVGYLAYHYVKVKAKQS